MNSSKRLAICLAAFLLGPPTLMAEHAVDGEWNGAIKIMGTEMGITARFEGDGDALSATLDIPQQGAKGVPLQNVSYQHPDIQFEIPGAAVAKFVGQVDGDSMSGEFLQSGMKGSVELSRRGADESVEAAEEVAEPLPYDEEEVVFVNGDVSLAGTLTLPRSIGPFPAVVMITGSGPQNRDEELVGFKPFRVIADYLTREGIAVLRYDDRGVGGSTGSTNDSTSMDFATDVVAAVLFLKQRADIDGSRIGAIGHSEGGIVAPIAAQSGELAFVVLLAGTSVTGEEILYLQGRLIAEANGATPEEIETQRAGQEQMMKAIRSGEGWEAIEVNMAEQIRAGVADMTEEQRAAIPDVDEFVKAQVSAGIAATNTPWFKAFIDYDPVPALEVLTVPALAIFGELDLQVPAQANADGMEKAFKKSGHEQYRIVTLDGANHLFQAATTGSPTEYATLKKELVPEFLPLITAWIKEVL